MVNVWGGECLGGERLTISITCSNYRSILSSYMEDSYYRTILFDNGDSVHWYMIKKNIKREMSHSVDLQSAAATLVASLWRKVCLRSPTGAETQNTGNSGYFPLGPWLMRNTFAKKRKQIGVEEHLT